MLFGKKNFFIVPAALWAIICMGYTYNATQAKKQDLYQTYMARYERLPSEMADESEPDNQFTASQINNRKTYEKEVRGLYWTFAPFIWLTLTAGGYLVAAGIILPIRRFFRSS